MSPLMADICLEPGRSDQEAARCASAAVEIGLKQFRRGAPWYEYFGPGTRNTREVCNYLFLKIHINSFSQPLNPIRQNFENSQNI